MGKQFMEFFGIVMDWIESMNLISGSPLFSVFVGLLLAIFLFIISYLGNGIIKFELDRIVKKYTKWRERNDDKENKEKDSSNSKKNCNDEEKENVKAKETPKG